MGAKTCFCCDRLQCSHSARWRKTKDPIGWLKTRHNQLSDTALRLVSKMINEKFAYVGKQRLVKNAQWKHWQESSFGKRLSLEKVKGSNKGLDCSEWCSLCRNFKRNSQLNSTEILQLKWDCTRHVVDIRLCVNRDFYHDTSIEITQDQRVSFMLC